MRVTLPIPVEALAVEDAAAIAPYRVSSVGNVLIIAEDGIESVSLATEWMTEAGLQQARDLVLALVEEGQLPPEAATIPTAPQPALVLDVDPLDHEAPSLRIRWLGDGSLDSVELIGVDDENDDDGDNDDEWGSDPDSDEADA